MKKKFSENKITFLKFIQEEMNQLQFVYLNDLSKKASWETT